uniref:Uncharacterized protein n=1 Tax=Oryza brachyantha TaxID=4533 RepID=J3MT94_ORYBR
MLGAVVFWEENGTVYARVRAPPQTCRTCRITRGDTNLRPMDGWMDGWAGGQRSPWITDKSIASCTNAGTVPVHGRSARTGARRTPLPDFF